MMGIFNNKGRKIKVRVRFNKHKAGEVTLIGRYQFEAYKKLCDGKVYEGIAYTDRYGRIVSVKLKEIPKVIFSARMFDFL